MKRTVHCPADETSPPHVVVEVCQRDTALRVALRFFPHAQCPELTDAMLEGRTEEALELVREADVDLARHVRRQRAETVAQAARLGDRVSAAAHQMLQRKLDAIDRELALLASRAA